MIHARWAIWGTLGCLTPEILPKYSNLQLSVPGWSPAGAQIFREGSLKSFGNAPVIHAPSIFTILPCWVMLIGAVETYRTNQTCLASKCLHSLPCATFDPLGLLTVSLGLGSQRS